MRAALTAAFSLVMAAVAGASAARAQYEVLHRFSAGPDGSGPRAGLTADGSGNIYGTTYNGGGTTNGGTVFRLQPPATRGGAWSEAILHTFDAAAGRDAACSFGWRRRESRTSRGRKRPCTPSRVGQTATFRTEERSSAEEVCSTAPPSSAACRDAP
jgi:hypothetical protein